jgi:predicted ribosomally synthesized peptide with SipW-like signal peptide
MKKILISLMTLVLVLGLVGAGTMAYFSDTETSTGNTFTAGTLNLQLDDPDEEDANGVTASWLNTNMAPGDSVSGWVDVVNAGTLTADHVEISFANTVTNVVTPAEIGADDTDISDSIQVTTMTYSSGGSLVDFLAITGGVFDNATIEAADTNNSDTITLDELDGVTLDDVTPAPAANGGEERFNMTIQLLPGTGNGNQGDSVTTVITFTLNQDASQ